jgi:hypothetical protein
MSKIGVINIQLRGKLTHAVFLLNSQTIGIVCD